MHTSAVVDTMITERRRASAEDQLRDALVASANTGGGWGYYIGKASRLEPTAWALAALGDTPGLDLAPHRRFIAACQRRDGWLVEDPAWPINISFNAVSVFLSREVTDAATDVWRRRVLAALIESKGVQAPQAPESVQNNSLQGWSWVDATFSWVEPTAWALLALKDARGRGTLASAGHARIAEAERLLIDRACRDGGWNFGNASLMNQDLHAYIPTSALGLLALRDRRDHPVVERACSFVEARWQNESSAISLALALLALDAHDRPVQRLEGQLRAHVPQALAFGNLHGMALALLALSHDKRGNVFRL